MGEPFEHHAAPLNFSAHQRAWWPALRAREHQPLPELPPVSLPATKCAGDEHFLPRSVTSIAKKARTKGWWVSITRAAGPRIDARGVVPEGKEQVFTIAVAAARGGDRLIWVWQYKMETWRLDEVFWNKKGLIDNNQGRAVLDA